MKTPALTIERPAWLWILAVLIALACGILVRVTALGSWPLAVDEYYIFRSVGFLLDKGIPVFPCGGLYARGLAYQYAVAPLMSIGLDPALALRSVTVASNLAMMPALYLLARSLAPTDYARPIAAAAVIVAALSVWEIEMARFGRMYAPFQAVFVWYLYHACQLMLTGDRRRWRWLFALSLLAPLVWEGGFLLSVLNFLIFFLRSDVWRFRQVLVSVGLLVVAVVYTRIPFRFLDDTPSLPAVFHSMAGDSAAQSASWTDRLLVLLPTDDFGATALIAAAAAACLIAFAIAIRATSSGVLTILSIVAITTAVALNQLFLAMALTLGAWLMGWTDRRSLGSRRWFLFLGAISLASVFWIALLLHAQSDAPFGLNTLRALAPVYAFPNYKQALIEPWVYTVPIATALLLAGAIAAIASVARGPASDTLGLRWLLLVVLVCATIVAGAPAPYRETRYSFFLYPALIVLTLTAFARLRLQSPVLRRLPAAAVPLAVIGIFLVSEDFPIRHLANIGSYEANFRLGYPARVSAHYYDRLDHRSPGDFLKAHAKPQDIVLVTFVSLQPYLPRLDYVYLSIEDERFSSQSCQRGTVERWSNAPLLYDDAAVERVLSAQRDGDVWVVVTKRDRIWQPWEQRLVARIGAPPEFTSPDGAFEVYRVSN